MCLFGLEVEAGLLAFFPVVLKELEKFDNVVVIRVSG